MSFQDFVGFALALACGICVSFSCIGFMREIRYRIALWRDKKALRKLAAIQQIQRVHFLFAYHDREETLRKAYVKRRESEEDIDQILRDAQRGKHANG